MLVAVLVAVLMMPPVGGCPWLLLADPHTRHQAGGVHDYINTHGTQHTSWLCYDQVMGC
jgi:hypothetical protein